MIKLSSEPLVPPLLIFPCTYTLDPIPYHPLPIPSSRPRYLSVTRRFPPHDRLT
jgi:hypothetical protein